MNIKPHFKFNKQERSGVFFLLLIIIIIQCSYFFVKVAPFGRPSRAILVDSIFQTRIDVLKKHQIENDSIKIYPFNPNFISDYKGYSLGMTLDEIDRLNKFRSQNKYVNTPKEFQEVTLVSDTLLHRISPYFKFPSWTQDKDLHFVNKQLPIGVKPTADIGIHRVKDLNNVTAKELRSINGIGDKLSARIIKFRDKLGGFLVDEQLYDVYALDSVVVVRALVKFRVLQKPVIQKININTASVEEIAQLVYIRYDVANKIVVYRNTMGVIGTLEELTNIENFPANKIDIIKLYLSL